MRFFHRFVTCKVRGHMSTGLMLTNMCDRCLGWFTVKSTVWCGDEKISRSRKR